MLLITIISFNLPLIIVIIFTFKVSLFNFILFNTNHFNQKFEFFKLQLKHLNLTAQVTQLHTFQAWVTTASHLLQLVIGVLPINRLPGRLALTQVSGPQVNYTRAPLCSWVDLPQCFV